MLPPSWNLLEVFLNLSIPCLVTEVTVLEASPALFTLIHESLSFCLFSFVWMTCVYLPTGMRWVPLGLWLCRHKRCSRKVHRKMVTQISLSITPLVTLWMCSPVRNLLLTGPGIPDSVSFAFPPHYLRGP
jgi:hypothetical protein